MNQRRIRLRLLDSVYTELVAAARRLRRAPTAIAREAIERRLARDRADPRASIAEYAAANAGSRFDLADLERAAIEQLRST